MQTVKLATVDSLTSPGFRRIDWRDPEQQTVHVVELVPDIISTPVDDDWHECDERDAVHETMSYYAEQIVCMRSPQKKTPPHADPISAIRDAIARKRFSPQPGVRYILDGRDITFDIAGE